LRRWAELFLGVIIFYLRISKACSICACLLKTWAN
jgi:hypothetical protein